MATIYCDTAGSNTSPYDTWAKAATTLATAMGAWSTGDIVLVKQNSAVENSASNILLPAAAATGSNEKLRVISANASDVYAASTTTANVEATGTADIVYDIANARIAYYGMYLKSADHLYVYPGSGGQAYFEDCIFEWADDFQTLDGQGDGQAEFSNCTFTMLGASAGFLLNGGDAVFKDCTFSDGGFSILSTGFIKPQNSSRMAIVQFIGCDFSDVDFTGSSLVDTSAMDTAGTDTAPHNLKFINCLMPASFDVAPSGTNDLNFHAQRIELIGCSSDNSPHDYELYTGAGTTVSDTTVKLTSGAYTSAYDGTTTLSHKLVPTAGNFFGSPHNGPWMYAWIGSTGSKTFTVKAAHTKTSDDAKDDELYIQVLYFGTTTESVISVGTSRPTDILAPSNLTDTSESWTGITPVSTYDLSLTATVNRTGWYGVRVVCEGLTDWTSAAIYYDPQVTVT